jgi:low temperature requirement protein LtrA
MVQSLPSQGESVATVGYGAAGERLGLQLAVVAALALADSATLWWAYFATTTTSGSRSRSPKPRPSCARSSPSTASTAGHDLILLGVIAIAAAAKEVVARPLDARAARRAIPLGAGAGAFLLGNVLFRRTRRTRRRARAVALALSAATIPLGMVAAVVQLGALVALLAAALATERRALDLSAGRTARAR